MTLVLAGAHGCSGAAGTPSGGTHGTEGSEGTAATDSATDDNPQPPGRCRVVLHDELDFQIRRFDERPPALADQYPDFGVIYVPPGVTEFNRFLSHVVPSFEPRVGPLRIVGSGSDVSLLKFGEDAHTNLFGVALESVSVEGPITLSPASIRNSTVKVAGLDAKIGLGPERRLVFVEDATIDVGSWGATGHEYTTNPGGFGLGTVATLFSGSAVEVGSLPLTEFLADQEKGARIRDGSTLWFERSAATTPSGLTAIPPYPGSVPAERFFWLGWRDQPAPTGWENAIAPELSAELVPLAFTPPCVDVESHETWTLLRAGDVQAPVEHQRRLDAATSVVLWTPTRPAEPTADNPEQHVIELAGTLSIPPSVRTVVSVGVSLHGDAVLKVSGSSDATSSPVHLQWIHTRGDVSVEIGTGAEVLISDSTLGGGLRVAPGGTAWLDNVHFRGPIDVEGGSVFGRAVQFSLPEATSDEALGPLGSGPNSEGAWMDNRGGHLELQYVVAESADTTLLRTRDEGMSRVHAVQLNDEDLLPAATSPRFLVFDGGSTLEVRDLVVLGHRWAEPPPWVRLVDPGDGSVQDVSPPTNFPYEGTYPGPG